MKLRWFVRKGIFFLPIHLIGWLILAATAALVVYRFIEIDRRSHSVSDTLMNWVFQCIIIGAAYLVIGFLASQPTKSE